jgi:hypothetical protein
MNSLGANANQRTAQGGVVELRVSTAYNKAGKSPFGRGKNGSPQASHDEQATVQNPVRYRGKSHAGASGQSPDFPSKRTTVGALSMQFGGGLRSASGSPEDRMANHETLANALVNSNERIQYGLSSN